MATHYIHSVSTEWPTHQCHVGVIGVRKQRLFDSHVLFFTLQTSQTDHKLEGPMIHVQHSHIGDVPSTYQANPQRRHNDFFLLSCYSEFFRCVICLSLNTKTSLIKELMGYHSFMSVLVKN